MSFLIESFGISATLLAIIGVYYNNRLDRICFYFWITSNALSCVLHGYVGLWSLAFRDAVFLVMAFEGLRKWKGRVCQVGVDIATGPDRTVIVEHNLETQEYRHLSPADLQKLKDCMEARYKGPHTNALKDSRQIP